MLEIMRRTLKNVTDDDIDMLLYYDTESALQIVNDLIDRPQQQGEVVTTRMNKIDKEVHALAVRIKRSANYVLYHKAVSKYMN